MFAHSRFRCWRARFAPRDPVRNGTRDSTSIGVTCTSTAPTLSTPAPGTYAPRRRTPTASRRVGRFRWRRSRDGTRADPDRQGLAGTRRRDPSGRPRPGDQSGHVRRHRPELLRFPARKPVTLRRVDRPGLRPPAAGGLLRACGRATLLPLQLAGLPAPPRRGRPETCSVPEIPRTIRERAWTPPIWYTP